MRRGVRCARGSFVVAALGAVLALPAAARAQAVTVAVDAAAGRRPIDPNVYGVAYATRAQLADLNVPLNRYGGNNTTRYNWQINADNRGQRLVLREHSGSERAPPASAATTFIADARSGRRAAGDDHSDHRLGGEARRQPRASWPATRSPSTAPQTGNDWQWFPDAGNGIRASDGARITWNDPTDANTPNNATHPARLDQPSRRRAGAWPPTAA